MSSMILRMRHVMMMMRRFLYLQSISSTRVLHTYLLKLRLFRLIGFGIRSGVDKKKVKNFEIIEREMSDDDEFDDFEDASCDEDEKVIETEKNWTPLTPLRT